MTNIPSAKPVIYVHAKGRKANGKNANKSLLKLGLPVCSHLDSEGLTKTDNSYDQPGLLIAELAGLFPGRPVLFLRAGLRPSKTLLNKMTGLLDQANQPLALTLLSNADNAVNPFAGLQAPSHASKINYAGLVNLLAPGQLHTLTVWTDHIVMLSADLVTLLSAHGSNGTLMQQLATAGGALKAADHLFLRDPDHKVFRTLKLETYETAYPPPFSELSARLQGWFNADIPDLPPNSEKNTPATLHITHSWGGGVAQWLKSFIEIDSKQRHFQLRSEAPQTGRGYGQRMCLYLGNELRCPVASWWLNPPVESISDSHDSYQMILSEIYSRYGIGRVFVSSLVGHSIDVFRSGLPTLQILHDNFPAWPLLSVNPQPYLRSTGSPDLERALFEHRKDREFLDKNAQSWSQIRVAYLQAITEFKVKIAAPGQSVVEMQSQLAPVFKTLATQVIPHGFPSLQNQRAILPKPRKDGRLRMVIPGRMQTGKGQQLLARAIPELAKHVQVYLLGTGKSGETFFGMAGVNVIPEYERDQLTSILTSIGPDFAALLSVVPETFSFTLSELQQLHIPTIATRLGNFPNRIEHGESGWLIDVDSRALVEQIITLCNSPDQIETVRTNLPKVKAVTLEDMLKAYNKLCPLPGENHPLIPTEAKPAQTQQAVADYQRSMTDVELQQALKWGGNLQREVERRTEWALETGRHLKLEQKQRKKWVSLLKIDIKNLQEMVAERQADLDIRNNQYHLLESDHIQLESDHIQLETNYNELEVHQQDLESKHQQLGSRFQQVSELNTTILGSSSWKITRPLRVVRRVISNFMLARAWNPARWPWLMSRLIGNLSTQGMVETLRRIQNRGGETIAEPQQSINTGPPNTELPGVETEAAKTNNVASLDEGTNGVETTGIKATNVESENPENRDSDDTAVETIVSVPAGESNAPSAFPNAAQPWVSIIIPVFNQWAYTAACLTSLLEIKGKYDFEIIIVDDQSSDETAHHLSGIEGLTHLRNKNNLGFVGGCNRGARHARGEYVVFLNNDTQVLQGWLDELIDTFDREPLAGLVGSRLVYPDGSLQESGGIIFNDGSGWNYGRDQNAEDPKYHFLRESDYVSGACIALKTKYFHELGAFDERYSPAYYEDTDLAFRVRESGRKVFIQPQSVIVHYEGVTSGTDTSSGTKKYQLINQKTFVERWQKALELQPEPVSDPFKGPAIRHASQHRLKGRILFIDATTPEPDKDSGSVRLTNLMQCFRDLGYGVTFFADNRGYAGSYTRDLQKTGIEVLFNPWLTSLHEFFRKRGRDFDYIFVSRHYIAVNYISFIKRYCHHARFIFDTVDLHYLREQRLAELEQSKTLKRTSRLTRHSELRVIKAADATLVVSSVEKEVLSEDAPGEKVHVLSNIHQVPGRNKEYADRKDIYFVGGYQHPPNVDAACWFVSDIWPLIHRQLPDMRFHLIGGKAPERVQALSGDGVVFHGFVESLQPFLSDCRLAVAPLRYGAGVKGKVNMSMAHGQPVVATPAAAEGIFAENGRELLIAENAEAFASEVVRLYQDEELWNRLSDASVQNVEDHFSMAAARDSLTALFDSFEN